MVKKIIVSSCFINKVRHDAKSSNDESINNFLEIMKMNDIEVIFVCPDVLGGLKIPRDPAEQQSGKVFTSKGRDVTENFNIGASKVLDIIKKHNTDIAILKSKSPSCGKGKVYDGNFNGTLVDGNGITTDFLINNGINVYSSDDLDDLTFIEKHFNIKLNIL